MGSWKTPDSAAWTFSRTPGSVFGHGSGTGDYGIAYAVQTEQFMLNGRASALITLTDRHNTGVGLICRAHEPWSFLTFYTAPADGDAKSTYARIAAVREGTVVPIATSAEPVVLSKHANRFTLEFFSGHVRGEIVSDDRTYELEATAPHVPFPGHVGVIKLYRAATRIKDFVAMATEFPYSTNVKTLDEFEFDVFLCHSSHDKPLVAELAAMFASAGIKYWLDAEQLEYGEGITEKIEEGLQRSRFVLPCFSIEQRKSGWVRAEYGAVLNAQFSGIGNRRAIPVLLDDVNPATLPMLLQDRKRVSAQNKVEFNEFIQFLRRR